MAPDSKSSAEWATILFIIVFFGLAIFNRFMSNMLAGWLVMVTLVLACGFATLLAYYKCDEKIAAVVFPLLFLGFAVGMQTYNIYKIHTDSAKKVEQMWVSYLLTFFGLATCTIIYLAKN